MHTLGLYLNLLNKNAMKKIHFLLIFLVSAVCAFPQFGGPPSGPMGSGGIPRIFSEIHVVPSDSGSVLYYSYRIPYDFLIFEKSGSGFKAGYNLGLEISDSLSKNIKRANIDRSVYLADFERTTSNKDFEEGVISVELEKGKYNVSPYFTDQSSVKEFKLRPHMVVSPCSTYLHPLVIEENSSVCKQKKVTLLANYNNDIPFSETPYSLIFPVTDTAVKELKMVVVNGLDTVFNGVLTENITSGIKIAECENNALVEYGSINKTKNFILRNLSSKLYEGLLSVTVQDSKGKILASFPLNVIWNNKPFSLMNYEFAIKALKNIEKPEVIDSLLSFPSLKYQQALFNYWKKYDKTPATKYNSLLSEFYSRVDFAAINFRTLGNKTGAETDRGKTFIKYGKPSKTDRNSNSKGKIIETWYYENIGLNFSFIDYAGTGDFTLIKNQ